MMHSVPVTSCVSEVLAASSPASVCSWNKAPRSGPARIGGDVSVSVIAGRAIPCYSPHGTRNAPPLIDANRFSLSGFEIGATTELYPRTNFRR